MDTPVVDRKIDPQIVAAWIAAGTSAATSALSVAFERVQGRQPLAGVVINDTPFHMSAALDRNRQAVTGYPVHGKYMQASDQDIPSLIEGAKKDEQTSEWSESNFTTWALQSRGSGIEVLLAFRLESHRMTLAVYAGNPVLGGPYAGACLSDDAWFNENHGSDGKGLRLIQHIKNVHTRACQFSRDGRPMRIEARGIVVEFTSAEQVVFRVSYTGDWSRYPLPR